MPISPCKILCRLGKSQVPLTSPEPLGTGNALNRALGIGIVIVIVLWCRKTDPYYQVPMINRQPPAAASAETVSNAYDNVGCQDDVNTSCWISSSQTFRRATCLKTRDVKEHEPNRNERNQNPGFGFCQIFWRGVVCSLEEVNRVDNSTTFKAFEALDAFGFEF